jgi:argininosuccinate synthase
MFRLTVDPESAPEEPLELTIGVEAGDPVSIDGEVLGPVELLSRLNAIAGAHGVGRIDIVENRFVGITSRGVYETPGGEVLHLRDSLATRYATMVYNGFWFSPERLALQSMMDSIQERVTGEARLVLYKGSVRTTGRRSPNSAYDPEVATFEAEEVYRQADAAGFISLNALRIRGFGDGT